MEKKKNQWKYHLLLFAVIFGMDIFADYVKDRSAGFLENFSYPEILNTIAFYGSFYVIYTINFFWLCPKTVSRRKIGQFIIGVFLLFFVYAGIRYFLQEILIYSATGEHNYYGAARQLGYYIVDNTYFALQAILYSTALYLLFEYAQNVKRINLLQLEQKKAELSLLKTQLEPHFLFNTLNTFYTKLVDTQPETAKDLMRLSQLLRYVTYEVQAESMPLRREIRFIEDYMYFQKKRFEGTLFLEYKLEGNVADQKVPALVFIHFVENIFKHGKLNDAKNPALINIIINAENIEIRSQNKISPSENYTEKGIGEENLK